MKIVVTGSCGFIGRHVCEALLERGDTVIGIDNFNSMIYNNAFKEINANILAKYDNYTQIRGDIIDRDYIVENNPDIVIHLAAHANVRKSFSNPNLYVENNVVITCKVINEVLRCPKKPLYIYASSSSVYGKNTKIPFEERDSLENVTSIYALSKKMCEEMASMYASIAGLKAIGLRFFTVYGPGGRPDMSIFTFLKKIYKGEPLTLYGDGTMKRDFTFVKDIVKGIVACTAQKLQSGENRIYNLGNNNPVNLNILISLCEKVVGKHAIIHTTDIPVTEVPITFADITKAQTDLSFQPTVELEEGITATFDWMKQYKELLY